MSRAASDLAWRLARDAEAVCRHYLPSGRRQGGYWVAGDAHGAPGRSLYVRLVGRDHGPGAAGKWTDAATGKHGDLLDLIAARCGFTRFADTAAEARRFLVLPRPVPSARWRHGREPPDPDKVDAARRLFAMSRPIEGTIAARYLMGRGILVPAGVPSLRFHPRCYYRPEAGPAQAWPAMIAAVTDLSGRLTGVQRTWLDVSGCCKAPVETPRRALGELLGNAVRFGLAADILAVGEGIETVLSLRRVMPEMPVAAALSAAHLAAIRLPPGLRRLYVACDGDDAGRRALAALRARTQAIGVEAVALVPRLGDFNEDLRAQGIEALREALRSQIAREDAPRFLAVEP